MCVNLQTCEHLLLNGQECTNRPIIWVFCGVLSMGIVPKESKIERGGVYGMTNTLDYLCHKLSHD